MGTRRNRRIDRVTAEQLLAGDAADGALGRLLADAGAPVGPAELAGEDAAVAMWRAAGRGRVEPVAPRRRWPTRVATVKIIAAALALGAGGVALAASTGVLSGPVQPVRPTAARTGVDTTGRAHTPPATRPTPGPDVDASGSAGTIPAAQPTATGAPQLAGLCHAYAAAVAAGHTDALDRPSYAPLIAAAGGRGQVEAFCAALLAPKPKPSHGKPTPAPNPDATSTGDPGKGNGKANGRPTTHPSH